MQMNRAMVQLGGKHSFRVSGYTGKAKALQAKINAVEKTEGPGLLALRSYWESTQERSFGMPMGLPTLFKPVVEAFVLTGEDLKTFIRKLPTVSWLNEGSSSTRSKGIEAIFEKLGFATADEAAEAIATDAKTRDRFFSAIENNPDLATYVSQGIQRAVKNQ